MSEFPESGEPTSSNAKLEVTKIQRWVEEYRSRSPSAILSFALQTFEQVAISFSGAEDVVLIDLASYLPRELWSKLRVFTLDTGRLHPETYRFLDQVRDHYQIKLEVAFPDQQQVTALVDQKGLFSFYKDGHKECCAIRKVNPLRKKLTTLDAWITGQRQDQNPETRQQLEVVELDQAFSTLEHTLIKFNPIANWTSKQVWDYIQEHNVPYNPLHERGFVSIGCEPCTRPILPNATERSGRWWWEDPQHKECGLHAGQPASSMIKDR